MRITNSWLTQNTLRHLQTNLQAIATAQRQVATGDRLEKASDDPSGSRRLLAVDRALRGVEQYTKNVQFASLRQDAERTTLKTVNDLLGQARQAVIQMGDAQIGTEERATASTIVDRILKQVIQLGNTKVGNEYIFAGENSDAPAFDTAAGATEGNYLGGTQARQTEIGDNFTVPVNETGDKLFGDPAPGIPGVISSLKALRDGLAGPGAEASSVIQTTRISDLQRASDAALGAETAAGATISHLKIITSQHTDVSNRLLDERQTIAKVSPEEAATRLLSLQTSLQAAYSATNIVLHQTLTNYLS